MIKNIVGGRWNAVSDFVRDWWNKRSHDQHAQFEQKREQNIVILQKRYGYTREKAIAELDGSYSKVKFG